MLVCMQFGDMSASLRPERLYFISFEYGSDFSHIGWGFIEPHMGHNYHSLCLVNEDITVLLVQFLAAGCVAGFNRQYKLVK